MERLDPSRLLTTLHSESELRSTRSTFQVAEQTKGINSIARESREETRIKLGNRSGHIMVVAASASEWTYRYDSTLGNQLVYGWRLSPPCRTVEKRHVGERRPHTRWNS